VVPDDADLVLVTHGHFDHAKDAPELVKASKKPAKVVCNGDIYRFYQKTADIKEAQAAFMNKGGEIDFGWCRVQMVGADHSSTCMGGDGHYHAGGEPNGFVIRALDFSVYHGGDTNVFYDMEIINFLYQPTHVLVPIGGLATMGPVESAYAVTRFFTHAKVVIPMHYGTFPLLPGTLEDFEKEIEKFKDQFKREPFKVVDPHTLLEAGKALPSV